MKFVLHSLLNRAAVTKLNEDTTTNIMLRSAIQITILTI
jgi:hypothetical protein